MQQIYAEIVVCKQAEEWQIIENSKEFLMMTGYTQDEIWNLFEGKLLALFETEDAFAISEQLDALEDATHVLQGIYLLKNIHGSKIKGIIQGERQESGNVKLWVCDATHLFQIEKNGKEMEVELRFKEGEMRKTAAIFDQIFACQLNISKNKIIEASRTAFPSYHEESNSVSDLINQNANDWIHPEDRREYLKKFGVDYLLDTFEKGICELTAEFRAAMPGSGYRWQQSNIHIVCESTTGEVLVYIYIKDIEEQKTRELELQKLAETDSLTGLLNRSTIEQKCERLLNELDLKHTAVLMSMDLDGFKGVNDTFGHMCGDQVLELVSHVIVDAFLYHKTLIGRFGGDEFIVFLQDVPSTEEALILAEKVCTAIFDSMSEQYGISVSIGISFAPRDGVSFARLYQAADSALFEAKRRGKNRCLLFDASMKKNGVGERNPVSRDWLLEEGNDIIYVADVYSYELLYMNNGAKKIFGQIDDSYKGRKCYEVLQNLAEPCAFCTNEFLSREVFYSWEYRNPHVGHCFLLKDRLVDWYGRPARIEFATDITLVDSRTRELEKQIQLDKAMLDLLLNNHEGTTMEEIIMELLESIGGLYKADRAFVVKRDEASGKFDLEHVWCDKNVKRQVFRDWEWEHFIEALGSYPKNRKSYWMDDLALLEGADPSLYRLYIINRVYCQRLVPFFLKGRLCGYIGIDNPSEFQDDFTMMEIVGYRYGEELKRRKLQERLHFLSYHDGLTGLQNRKRFTEYVRSLKEKPVASLGVACADLNALKEINRNRGHGEGDLIVKRAAALLRQSFSKGQIFRLSGDEFLVFCENISEQNMRENVQKVYDGSVALDAFGISIGHAWGGQEPDVTQLITQANDTMLIRKQLYYRDEKRNYVAGKHGHERLKKILESIAEGHFVMYLQPKVGCHSEQLAGAEALARFDSPSLGFMMPAEFVPEMEQYYMIRHLDLFMFEEVCRTLERWEQEGRPLVPISVNFSRLTLLEPDLIRTIENICKKYKVKRDMLEIEITESIGDYEDQTIAEIGSEIKKAGFRLSLDDFGSHYTNMSVLTTVPTDVLKIDRSLIRGILDNRVNILLLRHLFAFCQEMGIRSVAEGVENKEQLSLLSSMACDEIQGYLFGKPMTVQEFENLHFL